MRLPNGYGSVVKLSGNRRKPYQARVTMGFTDTGKQIYAYLGYYKSKEECILALANYNENPYDIKKDKITFKEVYEKWSKEHFQKIGKSSIENYSNCFRRYCKEIYDMRIKDIRLSHLQRNCR